MPPQACVRSGWEPPGRRIWGNFPIRLHSCWRAQEPGLGVGHMRQLFFTPQFLWGQVLGTDQARPATELMACTGSQGTV